MLSRLHLPDEDIRQFHIHGEVSTEVGKPLVPPLGQEQGPSQNNIGYVGEGVRALMRPPVNEADTIRVSVYHVADLPRQLPLMMNHQPPLVWLGVDLGDDLVQELITVPVPSVFSSALVHNFDV